jgi:hypothetical protein
MATTSSNLVAGKVASQGGNRNNGRYGIRAKLAAGVAILGLAAILAFGGAQRYHTAQSQPQVANSAVNHVDWEQIERTQVALGLPSGSGTAPIAPTQFGPQEFLPGEEWGSGTGTPSPTFGPQP